MKLYTIFGDPVSHSRSPLMHNHVFRTLGIDGCYTRTPLSDGNRLKEVFFAKGLSGANVTVPHKEAAYQQCDEVRGIAQTIKAVNTLINENGRLIGYNTDAEGFMEAIREFGELRNALIIGAGGTARALSIVFRERGIVPTLLNRSEGRLEYFRDQGIASFTWNTFTPAPYDLIVNTTSAGLSDQELPLPKELLDSLLSLAKGAVDVIYGKQTPFLQAVKGHNLPFKDGSDMLLEQGVLANHLFIDKQADPETIRTPMRESFRF
ncbi:MAG: shikimate dehydrogenase [Sulfuricurvum sp.]